MLKNTEGKEDKLPTLIDYDHVQLILNDAQKYNLEWEVKTTAQKYVNEGYEYVIAYQMSFEDWVK
tara:strand:+ start:11403 stop:11597 length:195 start_codon:yes stop_codon:yes gene_type:complete